MSHTIASTEALAFFSRITMLVLWTWSSISKVSNLEAFEKAVSDFRIIPSRFSRTASYLLVGGELLTALFVLLGNRLLVYGFLLASILLVSFSIALTVVILRRIEVPCNCLGSYHRPVSWLDLARNLGLTSCSLAGLVAALSGGALVPSTVTQRILFASLAAGFVVVLGRIDEIYDGVLAAFEPNR
jgi:hypothetical protein